MDEQHTQSGEAHSAPSIVPSPGSAQAMTAAAPPTTPGAVTYGKPVSAPQPPYDPKMFNTFYWLWLGLGIGGAVLAIVIVGYFLIIASVVFWAMFVFKAWNQIQDGHQRTSSGMAIGFMFIPLFNLYWRFIAAWHLTKDLNAYGRRWGISFPRVNEGLSLAACIVWCCTVIPLVNLLALPAAGIMALIVGHQVRTASMAIAQARLEGRGHAA